MLSALTRVPFGLKCMERFASEKRSPSENEAKEHPFKVNIWVGMSKRSQSPVLIFTGIMRREFYIEQILQNFLLPFTQTVFPDGYRFQ